MINRNKGAKAMLRVQKEESVFRELHTSLRDSWRSHGGEFQTSQPMNQFYFAHCSQTAL